jgi:hypothetical protein
MMENFNSTDDGDKLPQPTLEALQKLIEAVSSPETISFVLGLNIERVRKLIFNDPLEMVKVLESIRERSKRYRCVVSHRLMVSPMMAADGNYYEQSILPSISTERVIHHPKLKAEKQSSARTA